jgi:hypothetical protein
MPARTLTMTRSASGRTEHKPIQVVLYVRVSSKDQEKEGFSIPAQLRLLREYAASSPCLNPRISGRRARHTAVS